MALRDAGANYIGSTLAETPLKGLWTHENFYHDGRFATVRDVVEHYDKFLRLSLSRAETVAYLLSL